MDFAFLRLGDWYVKYSPVVVSAFLVMLGSGRFHAAALLATVAFSVAGYAYAFGLNYYAERDLDSIVGKNRVRHLPPGLVKAVLAALAVATLAPAVWTRSPAAMAIALYYLAMATLYSLPPAYFKARGAMGVISQAAFLSVPHLLFFVALARPGTPVLVACLVAWLALLTAKGATIHQIVDLENDVKTGLRTLAVRLGRERSIRLVDHMVLAQFALGVGGLLALEYPLGPVACAVVVFSNPRFRRARP